MFLGIEQFGNCEKPVVKHRHCVDGHLPTSAAAIYPRLRHFGEKGLSEQPEEPLLMQISCHGHINFH